MSSVSMAAKAVARGCVAVMALMAAGAAAAYPAQSWNGYHWARTGPLTLGLGSNLSTVWQPFLSKAAYQWSLDPVIDMKIVGGKTDPVACKPSYGGIQVCNADYGANNWLGYASVWLSNGHVIQGTVQLNEYYFSQAKYATSSWRAQVMCQEIGHTLGLAHTNEVRTDLNTGSCMDYTNDPSGLRGTNGTLKNTKPNKVDYAALAGIYNHLDASQPSMTKPDYFIGASFSVEGEHLHERRSLVPEPATWAMMIIGFGAVGGAVRRRRGAVIA